MSEWANRAMAAIKYRRFPKIVGWLFRFNEQHPRIGKPFDWLGDRIDDFDIAQANWRYRRWTRRPR